MGQLVYIIKSQFETQPTIGDTYLVSILDSNVSFKICVLFDYLYNNTCEVFVCYSPISDKRMNRLNYSLRFHARRFSIQQTSLLLIEKVKTINPLSVEVMENFR